MPRQRSLVLPALFAGIGALLSPVLMADAREPASVIAVQVQGNVSVGHLPSARLQPVKDNDALASGDMVETAAEASVVLVLPNGSTVSLEENSRLILTSVQQTPFIAPDLVAFDSLKAEPSISSTTLELKSGGLVAQVRKLNIYSGFAIKTPVGFSTVQDTEFELTYAENEAGESDCFLNTARGLVVFRPWGGAPVEAAASRQVEVRAQVGPAGVKLRHVQTHILPDEDRTRIQQQNETARQEVNQVLMRAKAMRHAPQPPEDRTVRPEPPKNSPLDNKPVPPKKPEKPPRPDGG